MIKNLTIQRQVKKRPDNKKLLAQIKHCADLALKSGRGRGWIYKIEPLSNPVMTGEFWTYTAKIVFKTTSDRSSLEIKWLPIVKRFARAGSAGQFQANPWRVIDPAGFENVAIEAKSNSEKKAVLRAKSDEPKKLGEINLEPGNHFDRLFGCEAQVRRIIDALKLAKNTEFNKRRNVLLDGLPGCGKSESMLAISKMLGEEGSAWLWFDATSMTKAGCIEEIIEAVHVPPVLFIEEIEKCEENSLRWLLGVMDVRGEIRRTNYRVGNQAKNVRMLVIATANDIKLLKSVMSGALYSRFPNKIYFPIPTRETMQKILEREIQDIKGNMKWVEPALAFGFDIWKINDPRELTTICTCGGDRLLTGEFQKDYEATMHPTERAELLERK